MPRSHPTSTVFLWHAAGLQQMTRPAAAAPAPPPEAVPVLKPSSSSKRQYPRLDMKLPILYRVLGQTSRIPADVRPYLLAESKNISPIGLCLNLEEPLQPGTVLALTFHMLEKREKFSAVGRVVWSEPAAQAGHYLTGLQFVVVEGDSVRREEHSRMETFIEELSTEAQ